MWLPYFLLTAPKRSFREETVFDLFLTRRRLQVECFLSSSPLLEGSFGLAESCRDSPDVLVCLISCGRSREVKQCDIHRAHWTTRSKREIGDWVHVLSGPWLQLQRCFAMKRCHVRTSNFWRPNITLPPTKCNSDGQLILGHCTSLWGVMARNREDPSSATPFSQN